MKVQHPGFGTLLPEFESIAFVLRYLILGKIFYLDEL